MTMPTPVETTARPDAADSPPLDAALALRRGVQRLRELQRPDGHFVFELEGDSILQSEYVLLKWILGHEDDPRIPRVLAKLRSQQLPSGAWAQYPTPDPGQALGGGRIDVSATVKAYFVLKLAGDDPDAPHMARARQAVLDAGGAEKCNTFSKFYLACLGQIDWSAQCSIPPELVYLPKWFYFHLDKLACWTRKMIQPLSIVTSHRPVREVPEDKGIAELYLDPTKRKRMVLANDRQHPFWSPVILSIDRVVLKPLDRVGHTPLRRAAMRRMEKWIVEHHKDSAGLGAIFPPMVYTQVALRCMGYPDDHPLLIKLRKDLDDFMVYHDGSWQVHDGDPLDRPDRFHPVSNGTPNGAVRRLNASDGAPIHLQPCFSPVWDSGITAYALADAGLTDADADVARLRDWLVAMECTIQGDWANNLKGDVPPGGWYFEYENPIYPDCDDSVMVAMALHRLCKDNDEDKSQAALAAAQRAVDWVLAMQNPDGGWAAFDRDACNRDILDHIPFADHNAMQDPSCADITGRTLECLGWFGYTVDDPAIRKAVDYVKSTQEPEGCWWGRWGVNYVYGTWQAIGGMRRVGVDMSQDWVQKAGRWLKSVQKPDGSFGESPDTYEDPALKGTGPSTASQTAWGAMAMQTIFGADDPDVARAIDWLAASQNDDGSWDEKWFTGTGFPRVFYLRYHGYRQYFPVMAIGRFLAERSV
ncbi:MAG: prenyltransferase/squalene oxidase repeat-containing protein [Planctomycetota bacterium]